MNQFTIFKPLFAQILLTFLVWSWLLYGRVSTLRRNKINPQKTADETKAKLIFKSYENQSDNLENLFELPVLFFTAVFLIAFTGIEDSLYVSAAWTFVVTRAIHSFIHCTSLSIDFMPT